MTSIYVFFQCLCVFVGWGVKLQSGNAFALEQFCSDFAMSSNGGFSFEDSGKFLPVFQNFCQYFNYNLIHTNLLILTYMIVFHHFFNFYVSGKKDIFRNKTRCVHPTLQFVLALVIHYSLVNCVIQDLGGIMTICNIPSRMAFIENNLPGAETLRTADDLSNRPLSLVWI